MPNTGRREVTEPIEVKRVGDRIHFDVISDGHRWPFSVSLHKAANAAMCTNVLLAEQREAAHLDNVRAFKNV
jgi:hypothetical protein